MARRRWFLFAAFLVLVLLLTGCDESVLQGPSLGWGPPASSPAPTPNPAPPQPNPSEQKPKPAPNPPKPATRKPEQLTREKVNAEFLALLNAERRKLGLCELTHSQTAERLAQRRAEALAAAMRGGKCGPTHDIPGLGNPWFCGECIHHGTDSTPRDAFWSLMGSPPHKAIMLDPNMRVMGVGFVLSVPDPKGGWIGNLYVLVFAAGEASQAEDELSPEKAAQKFLGLLNAERKKQGFAELVIAQDLQEAAQQRADKLATAVSSGEVDRNYPYLQETNSGWHSYQIWAYDVQGAFEALAKTHIGLSSDDAEFGLGFVPNVKGPNDNGMPVHLYFVLVRER